MEKKISKNQKMYPHRFGCSQNHQKAPQCTMNKTGSNSGHFVKYWVKLTLLKYTNKMVISDQKRKINGMAPKIPKVYQVWQLSC